MIAICPFSFGTNPIGRLCIGKNCALYLDVDKRCCIATIAKIMADNTNGGDKHDD